MRCCSVAEDDDGERDEDGDEDGGMRGKIGSGMEEFVRLANMLRSGHFPLDSISRGTVTMKTFKSRRKLKSRDQNVKRDTH